MRTDRGSSLTQENGLTAERSQGVALSKYIFEFCRSQFWVALFYTRSPARPNPLGLHSVTVREIDGTRVKIGPIEAFDGTPVVDVKSASTRADQ
jgi:hypothetical protein